MKPLQLKEHIIDLILALIPIIFVVIGIIVILFYPYKEFFNTIPKTATTSLGLPGDPINFVFVGSSNDIAMAFQKDGWVVPDPITKETSSKISLYSLLHKNYPTAPVSALYLFNRQQDLVFEKPTNDVQQRDHIRIWFAGGNIWVGSATYDDGIELSKRMFFPTHRIASFVDVERDKVGTELANDPNVKISIPVSFRNPNVVGLNGGGDYYATDGAVRLIDFTGTVDPSYYAQDSIIYSFKEKIIGGYTKLLEILYNYQLTHWFLPYK